MEKLTGNSERVLLLNPPPYGGINVVREGRCMQRTETWTTVWSPVSLTTTAAVLREAGFEPHVSDGIVDNIDLLGLQDLVRELKPLLAVVNTATTSIESDLSLATIIKEASPGTKVMVMGVHVSSLPEASLELALDVDMVVRGEPEYTVRDAALALRDGSDLETVQGLSFRSGDTVVHNENRAFIEDLDSLPFPAWDLVDTGKYRLPLSDRRYLLTASARGCPYACTFCANKVYYGSRLRKRSPSRIVDEMEWIGETFGITDFLIWSESFTNDQEYAIATAEEIINRGLDIDWVCNSRVDTVSPRLLRAIKQAGCWMIGYGIESGNQGVLDSVHKGTTLYDAVQAVRMAHEVGLEVTGHCVLGFPGETEQTMRETIDFAKFLRLDYAQFYCAVAFPGSRLYSQCADSGWLDTMDWSYYDQSTSVISTSSLTSEQVVRARDQAYAEFYRQPYIIKNTLSKIRSPEDAINFTRTLRDFLF